ncbi:DUF814 domain-containing protein [Candidatus Woesearchaeota archaeon]|nr:DUF814 domain-containing protein [Candidatus Woesearchaeota archaeon]
MLVISYAVMVEVTLYLNKSIDENAALYFEDGKKAKRKVVGVKKTLETFEKKKDEVVVSKHESLIKHIDNSKKQWFEKFKWFISSDGYLVIAGRDATTNEIIIKKHTDNPDLVFHTDMAGSPFVVIKSNRDDVKRLLGDDYKPIPKPVNELEDDDSQDGDPVDTRGFPTQTVFEAAAFTAVHSRAWKAGLGTSDVFFVKPDQVSKEANSGEFMPKGSFMIRGETNYIQPVMDFGIGILNLDDSYLVLSGPLDAVKAHCKTFVEIEQGNEKSSLVAKHIAYFLKEKESVKVDLDEIIKHLPSGGCQVKKDRNRKFR